MTWIISKAEVNYVEEVDKDDNDAYGCDDVDYK